VLENFRQELSKQPVNVSSKDYVKSIRRQSVQTRMNSKLKFVPPGMLARLSPDMHQQSSAMCSINTESILLPTLQKSSNVYLPESEEVTKNINSKHDINAGAYLISNSSRNIDIINIMSDIING